MTKDERQEISLQKIVGSNCRGTIEGCTAFGKTRIGIKTIKRLRESDAGRLVIVVVPTIPLKDQWTEELESFSLMVNIEVVVVNTLIGRDKANCSLLLVDEIHRMAAPTFSHIFEIVHYDFILGLTATLKRLDGKHELLNRYCPIIDTITQVEAKRNGWIAPYVEYNLGVPMTPEDREIYKKLTIDYGFYSGKFQSDFELMKNCSYSLKPDWRRNDGVYVEPPVVRYARRLGWRGNTALDAYHLMINNARKARGEHKDNLWDNQEHPYSPDKLYIWALNGMRTMRKMKEFIQDYPAKTDMAALLIERLQGKFITFGETIASAERLATMLGPMAVAYHSEVKAGTAPVEQVKSYKSVNDGLRWTTLHPDWSLRTIGDGGCEVYQITKKKVGVAETKRGMLQRILTDPSLRGVCTARALDQGANFPNVSLGIIHSRTSSPTQQLQRSGRILRLFTFDDGTEKQAILVNVYLEDTKDYRWLVKAQKKSAGALWVTSIEDILEDQIQYV